MNNIAIHTKSANLTEEQFFMLCAENDNLRFERDKDKNIIIMTPSGSIYGNYHIRLSSALDKWNEVKGKGYVFDSSAGFTLPNGAMRAPDISWIEKKRWERVSREDKERFAHICPDFVIEVRSKSDSLKKQQEKMQEWINNGCRMGWLIDVEHKTAYCYKSNTETVQQSFSQPLSGEEVLPGFELNLNEIIAAE